MRVDRICSKTLHIETVLDNQYLYQLDVPKNNGLLNLSLLNGEKNAASDYRT